ESERWTARARRRPRWRRSCSRRSTPPRWRPCAGCCESSPASTPNQAELRRMTEDRVLLITGASSGIGAQVARRAVEAGWRVALGARREDPLRELADGLGGTVRALAARCDVAEWAEVVAFARTSLEAFGRVDA